MKKSWKVLPIVFVVLVAVVAWPRFEADVSRAGAAEQAGEWPLQRVSNPGLPSAKVSSSDSVHNEYVKLASVYAKSLEEEALQEEIESLRAKLRLVQAGKLDKIRAELQDLIQDDPESPSAKEARWMLDAKAPRVAPQPKIVDGMS